eukprot:3925801-Amphidinium_carterae.2
MAEDFVWSATTVFGEDTALPRARYRLVGKQAVPDAARGLLQQPTEAAVSRLEQGGRRGRLPDPQSTRSKAKTAAAARQERGAGSRGFLPQAQSTRSRAKAAAAMRRKQDVA